MKVLIIKVKIDMQGLEKNPASLFIKILIWV